MATLGTMHVMDSQGRAYSTIDGESFYVPKGAETLGLARLRPDIPIRFEAIFELPVDSARLVLKVEQLGMFTGPPEEIIDLGL